MFAVRAAGSGDLEEMAGLIRARAVWMRSRGVVDWRGWRAYADHVALPAWVRFTCTSHRLAAYCRDYLSWTVVLHLDRRDGRLNYVLAHRAEPVGL